MPTKKTIDQILAKHPFFQAFAPDQIQLIAECAQNTYYKADTYIFHEAESASTFYLLRSGKVALETNTPTSGMAIIETINTGDVFGWSWLFPPYRWHFSARAAEDVKATFFNGACLRGKAEQNHEFGYVLAMKFAEVMMRRLQATRLQLLDIYNTQ